MSTKRKRSNHSSIIRYDQLEKYEPITTNQDKVFREWESGQNMILSGSPGTGKTFLALYLALKAVLDSNSEYENITLIRSIVPTRDIGFLPGNEEEKKEAYMGPYKSIFTEICNDNGAWNKLITSKTVKFESTSYIRGMTFDDTIIVVDEMQNLNFHELDSVITRVGERSKIIFCGDYHQSDFSKESEKEGINNFMKIIEQMSDFSIINFSWTDIIRSDFVRDYIMTKEMLGIR